MRASSTSALRIMQDRMAHASEILSHIRRNRLRWVEVPVTISYTSYSQAKGQGWTQAIRILFDYFVRR
jgi:polyprenyl-phospho-N-acetylgalactosaminyl synthase